MKNTTMIFGVSAPMPMRGEGDGMPSSTGRGNSAQRSALRKAVQFSRESASGSMGIRGDEVKKVSSEMHPVRLRSRKYEHITSTVSKFMLTGISEPRRFRSVPDINQVKVSARNSNKKFLHVTSTIQEFMKTGIRPPRRFSLLPLEDNVRMSYKDVIPSSRKFQHVASTVSKFLKTGIAEPRRYRSVPVVEEVFKPFTNKNSKFDHITSGIREYIRTGIFPSRQYTSLPLKETAPKVLRKKTTKFLHVKSRVGNGIKMPSERHFETDPKLQVVENKKPLKKMVPEQPEYESEGVEEIIANLVRQLRNVNGEQPTEDGVRLADEMTSDLNAKFPRYSELINSTDPFDLVFALGLGYHHKFINDFGK